jgi:hypothetical protein
MIINNNFQTTQFFGSMSDFKLFQERINGVTEVMVHPILKGDRLYDRGSEQLEDLCKIL